MTGQELKVLVNSELDMRALQWLGRTMTMAERRDWWTSTQAGVENPYLLVVAGTEEDRQAVLKAARLWKP